MKSLNFRRARDKLPQLSRLALAREASQAHMHARVASLEKKKNFCNEVHTETLTNLRVCASGSAGDARTQLRHTFAVAHASQP